MSVHVMRMPDLGEGIAEVELVAWRVQPGQAVEEDQILADVMTDKATIELPSPVAGRVLALGGEVGQVLAVGAELIRIESATAPQHATRPTSGPVPAVSSSQPPAKSEAAPPLVQAAPSTPPAPALPGEAGAARRPIASPAVRARAWALGVDLAEVVPTGTAGRVMQADLDAHVAAHPVVPPPRPAQAAPPPPAARVPAPGPAQPPAVETIRIVGLRRKIAQKMQESKRRIPHFTYVEEIDVTALEALRAHLNARWQHQRPHLTPLAFLARAVVRAVGTHPEVNATFDDEAGVLSRHGAVHLGMAAQTEAGLLVPVLRDAQQLGLWETASEISRLAALARTGRASRDELSGSTITLTSLGPLGGIVSTPVINHPEVAIVGVNRIVERPVVLKGAVVVRAMMNLSSSFDHRVVDGMDAALFIQAVRGLLEQPACLFVE